MDWTDLEPRFKKIYSRRSDALHAGKPIPWPMTLSPTRHENGAFEEFSGGLGSWADGDTYLPAAETPMYLNTFAYITREALLRWWESLSHHELSNGEP